MANAALNLNDPPHHAVGDYAAWSIDDAAETPFDMAWINITSRHAPQPHRIFPLGEPSLAVRRFRGAGGAIEKVEIVICCQSSRAEWYYPIGGEELIAFRLPPETAANALGIDPADYRDAPPLPSSKSLLKHFDATRRVADTAGPEMVANVFASDIRKAAYDADPPTDFVAAAAKMLRAANGAISISQLAARFDVSERHFRRQFRDRLGVSPKFYARRLRLSAAAIAADEAVDPNWADIAVACGFHDQAHLINEYRDLTGVTPAQSHRERTSPSAFSNTSLAS